MIEDICESWKILNNNIHKCILEFNFNVLDNNITYDEWIKMESKDDIVDYNVIDDIQILV